MKYSDIKKVNVGNTLYEILSFGKEKEVRKHIVTKIVYEPNEIYTNGVFPLFVMENGQVLTYKNVELNEPVKKIIVQDIMKY